MHFIPSYLKAEGKINLNDSKFTIFKKNPRRFGPRGLELNQHLFTNYQLL